MLGVSPISPARLSDHLVDFPDRRHKDAKAFSIGDLLAVGMTVLMVSMMVIMRRWPDRPATLAVGPGRRGGIARHAGNTAPSAVGLADPLRGPARATVAGGAIVLVALVRHLGRDVRVEPSER